jgi:NAD(P)H-dependent flavin oxidoreductase YrpB (nitropropane dioxygenase family)
VAAGRPPSGQRPGEGERLAVAGERELRRYDSVTPTPAVVGDIEALSMWAGQGVAKVTEIEDAGDIVRGLTAEAREALQRAGRLGV